MTSTITDIFRADLTDESRKMEVDYSSSCDEKIPSYKEMAASGKFIEAIDGLLSLEKQTRTVRKFLPLNFQYVSNIIIIIILGLRYVIHRSGFGRYRADMLRSEKLDGFERTHIAISQTS